MPPRSEAQRSAMQAAASGNSTIGIPKSVGKEFSDSDPGGKLPKRKKKKARTNQFGLKARPRGLGFPPGGPPGTSSGRETLPSKPAGQIEPFPSRA